MKVARGGLREGGVYRKEPWKNSCRRTRERKKLAGTRMCRLLKRVGRNGGDGVGRAGHIKPKAHNRIEKAGKNKGPWKK